MTNHNAQRSQDHRPSHPAARRRGPGNPGKIEKAQDARQAMERNVQGPIRLPTMTMDAPPRPAPLDPGPGP